MRGYIQSAITPRDRFLETAQKELAAFEQREREFSKKERQERAAQLRLPTDKIMPNVLGIDHYLSGLPPPIHRNDADRRIF